MEEQKEEKEKEKKKKGPKSKLKIAKFWEKDRGGIGSGQIPQFADVDDSESEFITNYYEFADNNEFAVGAHVLA